MDESKSIAFRLSSNLQNLAENRAINDGEKSVGTWCKKIITAELLRTEKEKNISNSSANSTEDDLLILLQSVGNTRELILRAFQVLFGSAEAADQFQIQTRDVEDEWENITENYHKKKEMKYAEFDSKVEEISEDVNGVIYSERFIT